MRRPRARSGDGELAKLRAEQADGDDGSDGRAHGGDPAKSHAWAVQDGGVHDGLLRMGDSEEAKCATPPARAWESDERAVLPAETLSKHVSRWRPLIAARRPKQTLRRGRSTQAPRCGSLSLS